MCRVCSPEQLTALALGEIRGRSASRLQKHVRACPDCRAEWEYLSQTISLARSLQNTTPPHPMKARLWAELNLTPKCDMPSIMQQQTSKGPNRMSFKLLMGIVTPTAVALALLMLPGKGRHSMSMASEIRQAVSQVNTWHLKGWKMQGKNKIPWEVWGRRAPFFYREQVGQDVIVDNGKLRTSVFAPLHRNNQGTDSGIVLKTPSLSDAPNVRWSYQHMVSQWSGSMRPIEQTGEEATFNFPESGVFSGGDSATSTDLLYTVDKQTWLPVRYEARLGKGDHKQAIALLTADYNAPLPVNIAAPSAIPTLFKVYDGRQPAPIGENIVTANGITVQATPLILTSDGMILLRVKAWIGGAPIDRYGPLMVNVNAERWNEIGKMGTPANTDEQKRGYTEVRWDGVEDGNRDGSSTLMLIAPVDPLTQEASPTELTLKLDVSSQLDTRLSGTMGLGDQQLSRQSMRLIVALPAPSGLGEQSLSAFLDRNWKQRSLRFEGDENLTASVDLARGLFYGNYVDGRNPDRPHLQQSLAYYEKFFTESSCPGIVALYHSTTAQTYAMLGNKVRARQLLQAIIADKRLDARLDPITNPMLANANPLNRKSIQAEGRRILDRERKSAQEALDTWAR